MSEIKNSEIIDSVKLNIKKGLELFDKMAIERGIEIWKPIDGYDNYEVSSHGRVKNNTGKIMKPRLDKYGYYDISLSNNGEKKKNRIHRLVALTFLDNPGKKRCVDHIDNITVNNKVSNLRFATNEQNQHNRKISKNSTSNVKGVTLENNRWRAKIKFNKKVIHIGMYDNIDDAKAARQLKAKELYGEYLNQCER